MMYSRIVIGSIHRSSRSLKRNRAISSNSVIKSNQWNHNNNTKNYNHASVVGSIISKQRSVGCSSIAPPQQRWNDCLYSNNSRQQQQQEQQWQRQQQQRRMFQTLATTSSRGSAANFLSNVLPEKNRNDDDYDDNCYCYYDDDNNNTGVSMTRAPSALLCQLQQVRWKRRDGHKAFNKPRRRTKKQRRKYNMKMKAERLAREKHSAPGSKAGKRREEEQERKEYFLNYDRNRLKELVEAEKDANNYTLDDAMMDDLIGNSSHLTSQPTPEPVYYGHRHKLFYNNVKEQMDEFHRLLLSQSEPRTTEEGQQQQGQQQQQEESRETQKQQPEPQLDSSSSSSSPPLLPTVSDNNTNNAEMAAATLPSDKSISLVLRAYRDRHGKRTKPIGIALALKHLLQELQIPVYALGEYSYTTLLTCCRTPAEGRKVFGIMKQNQHPVSECSVNILVDIYSKSGDYKGAIRVMEEMAEQHGIPPSLPAYTSLMAGCYKVCNDGGRVAHKLRAKAGDVAWEKWQEMRIVGIEADVMAYGAILRICAARGYAERAVNLLQEMVQLEVKPTTLCFTSALRAVSKSHEIAKRYQRGASRKLKRRERLTMHYGKLTRKIVIMAENAEVPIDDGFVSALILCAGSAGDSATAKAIYLAYKIRDKLDWLRTIGPESHLARLRGGSSSFEELENPQQQRMQLSEGGGGGGGAMGSYHGSSSGELVSAGTTAMTLPQNDNRNGKRDKRFLSYGEREYGKDTRIYSALLRSCAQAIESSFEGGGSLGDMWEGTMNDGFLCETSLRLINKRREPKYHDDSIPGMTKREAGMSALVWDESDKKGSRAEDYSFMGRKRKLHERRKGGRAANKFQGVYTDESIATTVEDLDPDLYNMYFDEDGNRKGGGKKEGGNNNLQQIGSGEEMMAIGDGSHEAFPDADDEDFNPAKTVFDASQMRWRTLTEEEAANFERNANNSDEDEGYADSDEDSDEDSDDDDDDEFDIDELEKYDDIDEATNRHKNINQLELGQEEEEQKEPKEEMYFDYDEMKWMTRKVTTAEGNEKENSNKFAAAAVETTDSKIEKEEEEKKTEMYFDYDTMKWKTGSDPKQRKQQKEHRPTKAEAGATAMIINDSNDGDGTTKIDFYEGKNNNQSSSVKIVDGYILDENDSVQDEEVDYDDTDDDEEYNSDEDEDDDEGDDEDEEEDVFDGESEGYHLSQKHNETSINENSKFNEGSGLSEEEEYSLFLEGLREEIADSGESMDVSEEEARELFRMMKEEFNSAGGVDNMNDGEDSDDDDRDSDIYDINDAEDRDDGRDEDALLPTRRKLSNNTKKKQSFDEFFEDIKDEWREDGIDVDAGDDDAKMGKASPAEDQGIRPKETDDDQPEFNVPYWKTETTKQFQAAPAPAPAASEVKLRLQEQDDASLVGDMEKLDFYPKDNNSTISSTTNEKMQAAGEKGFRTREVSSTATNTTVLDDKGYSETRLLDDEIQSYLPELPRSRIKQIRKAFHKKLSYPSVLTLIPILRETMPDHVTNTWLKKMNSLTAQFVIDQAEKDGYVDEHLVNGLLQVATSAGSIDRALSIHQERYEKHNLKPSSYSDRLVFQMLLQSKRLDRALVFKQRVEEQYGRTLDLRAYGTLIDYCAKYNQLGSALLFLKECFKVHRASPGEKYVARFRILCRQQNLRDKETLNEIHEMIGDDPIAWYKHGKAHLQFERTKKGRRDINYAKNAPLRH